MYYTLPGQGGSKVKYFAVRCGNVELSQWSYFIDGCTEGNWNKQFLNNVPLDKVKNWIITKTSSHLKVIYVIESQFSISTLPWIAIQIKVMVENYGH